MIGRAGLALVVVAVLAGCAPTAPTKTPGLPSPVASLLNVVASEAALSAAGRAVLACYAVPACARVAPKPQLKAAYDQAYTLVVAAQASVDAGGTPDMTAATAAMAALEALVARLPVTTS